MGSIYILRKSNSVFTSVRDVRVAYSDCLGGFQPLHCHHVATTSRGVWTSG